MTVAAGRDCLAPDGRHAGSGWLTLAGWLWLAPASRRRCPAAASGTM